MGPFAFPMRAVVVTVSTSRAREGDASPDEAGDRLEDWARTIGCETVRRELVPDDPDAIATLFSSVADGGGWDLVLSTGGTGFSPDDRTPEATLAVVDRLAPGLAEAMRLASADQTPHWMLSRGVAGSRAGCLIVNFPGSPKSIETAGRAIELALPHAVAQLRGSQGGHIQG